MDPAERDAKEQVAERIRRSMWGDDHAARLDLLRRSEPALAELVVREVFGGLYADERLSLQQRSLCTISTLVTQGRSTQLASHLEAALNVGLTRDTLSAVMAHLFLYTGLPSVIEGLRVLESVSDQQTKSEVLS
jgi:4-carboxymuconolactone decarboxylase